MAGTHSRPKVRRNNAGSRSESAQAESSSDDGGKTDHKGGSVRIPSVSGYDGEDGAGNRDAVPMCKNEGASSSSSSLSSPSSKPLGILRKPKYGGGGNASTAETVQPNDDRRLQQARSANRIDYGEETPTECAGPPPPAAVRALVVERPRQKRSKKANKTTNTETTTTTRPQPAQTTSPMAIEGYTPRHQDAIMTANTARMAAMDLSSDNTGADGQERNAPSASSTQAMPSSKEGDPVVLSSLADLLETSGVQLPPKDTPLSEASLVEANLEFAVMDPQEYDELKEEERKEQYQVFMGQPSVFQEDETDKENSVEDPDDNDDNAMNDDYFDNSDGEDEEEPSREPRSFIKLWEAVSQWITPQAVAFVKALRSSSKNPNELGTQSAVDRSDLGASRCAGLMAMIQLHFRSVLEELGHDLEERRMTERLVGDLLRTFDYGRPSPKLDMAHSKALTAILFCIVWHKAEENNPATEVVAVPPCCQKVGLVQDEFRYLTVSAITNLATE